MLQAVRSALFARRRNVTRLAVLACIALVLVVLAFSCLNDARPSKSNGWTLPARVSAADLAPRNKMRLCDGYDEKALPRLLAIENKYDHLLDDKFTIVIQSYQRPSILDDTLHSIFEDESSQLDAVIVVWNDPESKAPDNWVSPGGIPLKFRQSQENSLNQKLKVDPDIRTKAVLLGDDDTYYTKSDMEYAFKIWREMGQNRLVGAWPRAARLTEQGTYRYGIPTTQMDYNMILTGLAFTHIAFMDYYSSDDRIMSAVRRYVDRHFNCEDIAMNFMTQSLTGCPPMFVKGQNGAMQTEKPEGTPRIGKGRPHAKRRNQCLVDFEFFFKKWPLKMQEGYFVQAEINAP